VFRPSRPGVAAAGGRQGPKPVIRGPVGVPIAGRLATPEPRCGVAAPLQHSTFPRAPPVRGGWVAGRWGAPSGPGPTCGRRVPGWGDSGNPGLWGLWFPGTRETIQVILPLSRDAWYIPRAAGGLAPPAPGVYLRGAVPGQAFPQPKCISPDSSWLAQACCCWPVCC